MLLLLFLALSEHLLDQCPDGNSQIALSGSLTDCVINIKIELNSFITLSASVTSISIVKCIFSGYLTNSEYAGIIFLNRDGINSVNIDQSKFFSSTNINKFGCCLTFGPESEIVNNEINCTDSEFVSVSARNSGAAIYCLCTYLVKVIRCKFSGIKCGNDTNGEGGAVWCSQPKDYSDDRLAAIFEDCSFTQFIGSSSMLVPKVRHSVVKDCIFKDGRYDFNTRSALLYPLYTRSATIINCQFSDNINRKEGASSIHFQIDVNLVIITNCVFNNSVSGFDIYGRKDDSNVNATLTNCTFAKRTKYPSIMFISKTGKISFTSCCFYSFPGYNFTFPYYLSVESAIAVTFDSDCCVDMLVNESVNIKVSGEPFDCIKCKPAYLPTPAPCITNPPQRGQCPSPYPYTITRPDSYVFYDCTYITDPRSFRYSNIQGNSITLTRCEFYNLFVDFGSSSLGGAVIWCYDVNNREIRLTSCKIINCGSSKNYGGTIAIESRHEYRTNLIQINKCTFDNCTVTKTGAAIWVKGAVTFNIDNSFINKSSCVLTDTEGGVIYSGPPSGNQGTTMFTIRNTQFCSNQRCITAKVKSMNITMCNFIDCYSLNETRTGGALFIPIDVYPIQVEICKNNFTNCSYCTASGPSTLGGRGGAIFIAGTQIITISENFFVNCTASTAGSCYLNQSDTSITVDNNHFIGGNAEIYFGNKQTGVITRNIFIKRQERSSFFGRGVNIVLRTNCFKLETDEMYIAHYIVTTTGGTVSIEDNNCFDLNKSMSVNVAGVLLDEPCVYNCNECKKIFSPEESNLKDTKNAIGTDAVVGIAVGSIIVVAVVVVIIILKLRPRSIEENTDDIMVKA